MSETLGQASARRADAGGGDSDGEAPRHRPPLVCFSHLRWDFVWQRPQHLLSRASRRFDVTYLEEPIYEPGGEPRLDLSERQDGVRVAVPVLPEGSGPEVSALTQRMLVEGLVSGIPVASRLFWYYTPMAMAFSGEIPSGLTIFDNMDELSAFRGASPELIAYESALLARADLVFTGGMSLYEAKRDRHPHVYAFPSSIEAPHFAAARSMGEVAEPHDQKAIGRPRIGFFGVIDERMDVDLVAALAELRPDWHFVMIGPVVKIDPATLPRRGNVHWLGPKSYDVLPRYLAGWDAGFMPFAINEATRFISPTKTPEFLAAGLPVVSTPIRDVVRPYGEVGLVEIAGTAAEMAARLDALFSAGHGDWLKRVDRHLATMSWDLTWDAMETLVVQRSESLSRPPMRARPAALPILEAAK